MPSYMVHEILLKCHRTESLNVWDLKTNNFELKPNFFDTILDGTAINPWK